MKRLVSAIILCGGKATRLRPVTQTIPKAMVKVKGRPIIDHQLEWLEKNGITDVVLACGYKWKVLKDHLGKRVKYSVETKPLGTGGALRAALEHIESNDAVVLNGDNISDISLKYMIKSELVFPNVALVKYRCPYGVYRGGHFEEKPLLDVWVNAGVYYFSKYAINSFIKMVPVSLEKDFFANTPLAIYKHKGKWVTVDTKKDVEDAEELLK